MNTNTYIPSLMSSFYLWLDHEILQRGTAYTVYSGVMYSGADYNYSNLTTFTSPFRQWVSDSSVSGAVVPSGVYVNGAFVARGTSGLALNFNKGEAIFTTGISATSKNVSARYSVKDFNIYYTDERVENLLFENREYLKPKFNGPTGGLLPDDQPYPCIYLKNTSYENRPFTFGGQDQTKTTIRCIILSDSMFLLDGAISIMTDSARKVFPIIPSTGVPYGYYGDFKSGISSYNYTGLAFYCQRAFPNDTVYIDRVTVSRLDEIKNKHINLKTVAALVDFDLWQGRYPRQYS